MTGSVTAFLEILALAAMFAYLGRLLAESASCVAGRAGVAGAAGNRTKLSLLNQNVRKVGNKI